MNTQNEELHRLKDALELKKSEMQRQQRRLERTDEELKVGPVTRKVRRI